MVGVEAAVDVEDEAARPLVEGFRAGPAHRVVPETLSRVEHLLGIGVAPRAHVSADDPPEALPVFLTGGQELRRQQLAFRGRQVVEGLLASEGDLVAHADGYNRVPCRYDADRLRGRPGTG